MAGVAYDQPALDAGSIDLSTTIDVNMCRLSGGVAHRWKENFETIVGAVG